jgi:hypothetical protein
MLGGYRKEEVNVGQLSIRMAQVNTIMGFGSNTKKRLKANAGPKLFWRGTFLHFTYLAKHSLKEVDHAIRLGTALHCTFRGF